MYSVTASIQIATAPSARGTVLTGNNNNRANNNANLHWRAGA
jgi:hypothetical protein